jgi:cell division protein FtsB
MSAKDQALMRIHRLCVAKEAAVFARDEERVESLHSQIQALKSEYQRLEAEEKELVNG